MSEIADLPSNDAGKYYRHIGDGDVIPLDPISHEPIKPGAIPEGLANDPELAEGYTYLQENANRIEAQVLLSKHTSRADLWHSGVDLETVGQALAARGGVLFLEGSGTRARFNEHDQLFNHAAQLKGRDADDLRDKLHERPDSTSFTVETLYQLVGSGVTIRRPDYSTDGDSMPEQALAGWWERLTAIGASLEDAEGQRRAELQDDYAKLYFGFVAYRDWFMVGRIGAQLEAYEEMRGDRDKKLAIPDAPVPIAILVGRHHENIGVYLSSLGINTTQRGERNQDDMSKHVVTAAGQAVLSQSARVEILAENLQTLIDD